MHTVRILLPISQPVRGIQIEQYAHEDTSTKTQIEKNEWTESTELRS